MINREEIKRKMEAMSPEELIDLYIEKETMKTNLDETQASLDIEKVNHEVTKQELDWYRQQIALLKKARFGSSSEK